MTHPQYYRGWAGTLIDGPRGATLDHWSRQYVTIDRPTLDAYQTFDGRVASLSFDAATHLLTQIEYLFEDPIVVDSVNGVRFGGYAAAAGGIPLPRWREQFRGDAWAIKTEYVDVALNRDLLATLFEMPADYELRPTPPAATVRLEPLGNGVHVLSGLGSGGRYNVLVVEFTDHLVVVNAPAPAAASQRALDELSRAFPSKPVRVVVLTHAAYDHIAGVRAFVAAGATVMTTATTKPMAEQAVAATMRLEPDALSKRPRQARIDVVRGQQVLTDIRTTRGRTASDSRRKSISRRSCRPADSPWSASPAATAASSIDASSNR